MSIEKASLKKEVLRDPTINEILDAVNFKILRAIFEEYAKRSGINPESMKFIERSDIKESGKRASLLLQGGGYDIKTHELSLASGSIKVASRLSESDIASKVLSMLIHEETHVVGHNSFHTNEHDVFFDLVTKKIETMRSGFFEGQRKTVIINQDPTEQLRWFNEGVVDEIAHGAYNEYLRRSPLQARVEGKNMEFTSGYPVARTFVQALCEKISEEANVPKEKVMEALISSYMRGDSLLAGELRETLEEIFSQKFIDRLAQIHGGMQIASIVLVFKEVLTLERVKQIFTTLKTTIADTVRGT